MIETRPTTQHETPTRPELVGYSNLVYLPTRAPDVPLYSKNNNGREKTVIQIKDVRIGGPEIILMAGPCSLDNYDQMLNAAYAAKEANAKVLRGGAFKPRTSPYSFQGRGKEALIEQRHIADQLGMLMVTEATGESNLEIVAQYTDIIQIGARNAQSYEFLAAVGMTANKTGKAVLYKRGPWMKPEEWMLGAEYILATGCKNVILCERGTILPDGSFGPDLVGLQEVRATTHLPIIVDPTHSAQDARQVPKNALDGIRAGADGLLVEVHPKPDEALCDGKRAVLPEVLKKDIADRIDDFCPPDRYYCSF